MRIELGTEAMMEKEPKKLSDQQEYRQYFIHEIEKGEDPDSFLDWYIDKHHGHKIEAAKRKSK